jgi:IS30 family transposase
LSNRRLIEDRPKIVDLKQRFGDLEIDTIIGKNHSAIVTT